MWITIAPFVTTEVPVTNLDAPSVVATTLIQTLDWRQRKARLITEAEDGVFNDVLERVITLIGGEHLLK
ncbi:transcription elongation factor GreAB [Escherichia coli]